MKVKCVKVGEWYEQFFEVGAIYEMDDDNGTICDWAVESDKLEVRECWGWNSSPLVASFEKVSEE